MATSNSIPLGGCQVHFVIPKILHCRCLKSSGYQHLCVCVYMFVWGGAYVHVCICMLALCVLISYPSSCVFLETGLSLPPELTGSARLVGQLAQGPSPALRLKLLSSVPTFIHGCWNLNSDCHACTCPASPLGFRLSPLPGQPPPFISLNVYYLLISSWLAKVAARTVRNLQLKS